MKTENWIDIRERTPEGRVIFLWDINHPQAFKKTVEDSVSKGIGLPTHTHWHPAIIAWMPMPEFAPKEPMQEREDNNARLHWRHFAVSVNEEATWHAAIFYERSAIRHLIQRYRNNEITTPELIRLISERVKL